MKCEFLEGHICQVILCLLKNANCNIVDSGKVNTTTILGRALKVCKINFKRYANR